MRRHNERGAAAVPVDEVNDVSDEEEADHFVAMATQGLWHLRVMPMR
jgi:hypothetical protein